MPSHQHVIQSSTLPPAQPTYVFRGHNAQIHAVHFLRQNLRLLSGDVDGWVVLWSIPIKRPVAVWKAHQGAILGLGSWGDEKIITHGRDNKLHVWHLREDEEKNFSTTLPIDDPAVEGQQPWLLHSLAVNAINFCSYAMCKCPATGDEENIESILIATPGVQDGHINLTSLPSEGRAATIPTPRDTKTGMVMAIGLQHEKTNFVLAGYESGHVAVWRQDSSPTKWLAVYVSKAHTQPVLSLDSAPELDCFFSSSADAIIARHPLSDTSAVEVKSVPTKHAGQQSLCVRSDGKVFATAGWDGRIRVYSPKSMKELAVLRWHKEGCYAVAFADIVPTSGPQPDPTVDDNSVIKRDLTVSEQRMRRAKSTHWLAAGSKDGKVSLWDIY